mgnify:CR=1 FL=1
MDTPRVLVAEDDPSVRKAVERVLELENYAVTSVGDGADRLSFEHARCRTEQLCGDIPRRACRVVGIDPEVTRAGDREALLRGDTATPRERELERKVDRLTESLKDISVRYALAQQAVDKLVLPGPTRPARSRRR